MQTFWFNKCCKLSLKNTCQSRPSDRDIRIEIFGSRYSDRDIRIEIFGSRRRSVSVVSDGSRLEMCCTSLCIQACFRLPFLDLYYHSCPSPTLENSSEYKSCLTRRGVWIQCLVAMQQQSEHGEGVPQWQHPNKSPSFLPLQLSWAGTKQYEVFKNVW